MSRFLLVTPRDEYARVFKTFEYTGDRCVTMKQLRPGSTCSAIEHHFDTFEEMCEVLEDLQTTKQHFLLRSRLTSKELENKVIRRQLSRRDEEGLTEDELDWIVLDIDGMPQPEHLDPINLPEEAIAHVIASLPPYFHEVSCWWQFSSSQSLPGAPKQLKVHLFYLLKAPVASNLLVNWAHSVKSKHYIDPAVFQPNQPIYVAAPEFVGGVDPLPRRSGVYLGLEERVNLNLSPQEFSRRTTAKIVNIDQKRVLAKCLKPIIGDGPGRRGFNEPIKSAIGATLRRIGTNIDKDTLKSDIRAIIAEAPCDDKRSGRSRDEYMEDAYLNPLIDAILDREQAQVTEQNAEYEAIRNQYCFVKAIGKFYDIQHNYYIDKTVLSLIYSKVMKSLGDILMLDDKFKIVDFVTYYPKAPKFCDDISPDSGAVVHCYNAYTPAILGVEDEAIAKPFFDHLLELCDYETETYNHIVDWLAFNVQRPGEKIFYSVLLQGMQGIGKSAIYSAMASILGHHNVRMVETHEIAGNFTSWVKNKSLVVVEEVRDPHDKFGLYNRLKTLITAPMITINEKNIPSYVLPNRVNMLAFTNYVDAIPMDDDDRRFLVHFSKMKVPPREVTDAVYNVVEQHPGAIKAALMKRDLSKFNPKGRAPMTATKREVVQDMGPPVYRYLKSAFENEEWPLNHDIVVASDIADAIKHRFPKCSDVMVTNILRQLPGATHRKSQVRLPHGKKRPWILRNVDKWEGVPEKTIVEEYMKPIFDYMSREETYTRPRSPLAQSEQY